MTLTQKLDHLVQNINHYFRLYLKARHPISPQPVTQQPNKGPPPRHEEKCGWIIKEQWGKRAMFGDGWLSVSSILGRKMKLVPFPAVDTPLFTELFLLSEIDVLPLMKNGF